MSPFLLGGFRHNLRSIHTTLWGHWEALDWETPKRIREVTVALLLVIFLFIVWGQERDHWNIKANFISHVSPFLSFWFVVRFSEKGSPVAQIGFELTEWPREP